MGIEITQSFLRETFKYDEVNGGLIFNSKPETCQENRRWNTRYAGNHAGSYNKTTGYLDVKLFGKKRKLHRLVFLYLNGHLPKVVDHIDGDKLNNRGDNLREANHQQNNYNSKISKNSTSGVKGITWHKQHGKWYASLRVDGRPKFLGLFEDLEEAKRAIRKAREFYHGEFCNHG